MSPNKSSAGSFLESSFSVRKKIKVYFVLVVTSFLVILMRVWYLQILKGEDFMGQSEQNRVRKISLADYRGEIGVLLINHGTLPFAIENGERIAQLVLAQYERIVWKETETLPETDRGAGGFGSTGNH